MYKHKTDTTEAVLRPPFNTKYTVIIFFPQFPFSTPFTPIDRSFLN